MVVSLAARIPDGAAVLIDTNPLIYLLEGSRLARAFEPVFADVDSGRIQAVTTPVTLAEVVAGPLKAGNEALAARYRRLLTASPGWSLCPIDAEIAVLAARLRLRHRLKLPDAIQLAAAIHEGCFAVLTHDRDFGRPPDVVILGG
jgi:predicted nucleic acid-binding protein